MSTSFTGSIRYMFNNGQDVMIITCNVNWSEIRDFVLPRGLSASDKPDIVGRVFKIKLDEMMTNFKKKDFFAKNIASMFCMQCHIICVFIKL